ncbi:adaptin N terminal region-domain-containing protein [Suillus clintonianus]|uniref:adaptin N terminal region-domain-containing protein n=1 Tax=Suillus clintonianus TaxID=1904413 RepID=UPI001B88710A|nr:adaptin N terminal region-domain-containing protein [Suillus clintonianus]KAG2151481.1 adaptin N terminal region-domain-containing protein [Suillus clintonianus]
MAAEAPFYTVVFEDTTESSSTQELRASLEKGTDEERPDTLRRMIIYIIPSRNKLLKKLLHFYLEVCPKYDENGKFKQEMILISPCHVNAIRNDLPRYIRCMFELLSSSSHAVKYEAATTLTTLTQNPTAVKADRPGSLGHPTLQAWAYSGWIDHEHLAGLVAVRTSIEYYLKTATEFYCISADIEVRRKAVSIVLSMTSSRIVEEVVLFLKKQLQWTQEREFEKAPEYRQLLVQSIHVLAVKFSEVAASVVHALMEFLGDSNNPSALDVVAFVREAVEEFPHLRQSICDKLTQTLTEIESGKAFRSVLWILGEYVENLSDIQATFQDIRKVLGEIPILASEQRLLDNAGGEEDKKEDKKVEGSGRPEVLADPTYATEMAYTSTNSARLEAVKAASKSPLRGDFFTGSVLASTLTKLVLRFDELANDSPKANSLRAECSPTPTQSMLIMTSIIRVWQSKFVTVPIDDDSNERILNCTQTLSELQEKSIVHDIFLKDTKATYTKMLVAQEVGTWSPSSRDVTNVPTEKCSGEERVGKHTGKYRASDILP